MPQRGHFYESGRSILNVIETEERNKIEQQLDTEKKKGILN